LTAATRLQLASRAEQVLEQCLQMVIHSQPAALMGLSVRAIDVLRLVAVGRANCEIADALVISQKTAINHMTHIFDKLGVSSRAAATAYALRDGIA
jgi:DNA-binding NarL/FixJ family response regulator